jgi:hypothetical protein
MAFHVTDSGSVELIRAYPHGHYPADAAADVLIFDDGDGHYSTWKVDGGMRDATKTLAFLHFKQGNHEIRVCTICGSCETIECPPEGFGRDIKDDAGEILEVIYDPAEIPERRSLGLTNHRDRSHQERPCDRIQGLAATVFYVPLRAELPKLISRIARPWAELHEADPALARELARKLPAMEIRRRSGEKADD